MIVETYCYVKIVGPSGDKVRGCKQFDVHNPEGNTSISSPEFETLSIPRDGVTFYIMNKDGDTVDKYPRQTKKEGKV